MQLYQSLANGSKFSFNELDAQANVRSLGQIIRQVERMAQIGFWRLDLASGRLEWSAQVFAIHDLPFGKMPSVTEAVSYYAPGDQPLIQAAIDRAANDGASWDVELDIISALGKRKRVRAIGEPEFIENQMVGLIGTFQDITSRHEIERGLEIAAHTDELTGLPNRRHLARRFEKLKAEPFQTFALSLFDLDYFKLINDRYGHKAGDEVLCATAGILNRKWLGSSFGARLGGDEFVLIMTDHHLLEDIAGTTQRLVYELQQNVPFNSRRLEIGATVGVAVIESPEYSLSAVLSCADAALYCAKENGRGTAVISTIEDMFFGQEVA